MIHQTAGFVDLQVNGYLGIDFGDADNDDARLRQACDGVLASGTSAFLPTLITAPLAIYEQTLPRMAAILNDSCYQGRLLGLHLEGPFLSPKPGAIGAHNPDYCQAADPAILERLQALAGGHIKLLTIAADLPGADELCRAAVAQGIQVALGHSLAECEDMARLAAAGASSLTHLGNGIPNHIDRHHNPIWSGLAQDALSAMIITDGHHLPASVQKVMLRAKGIEKTIVVSDASPIAGLAPGAYDTLGNNVLLEENGKLHNPEKGCLVGSSAMMFDCMNQLASLNLLSFEELMRVSRSNPLALLKIDPASIHQEPLLHFDADEARFTLI